MHEQPEKWKRLRSETIADCRVFKVRKDFCERENGGSQSTFFVLENPDWVNIIALTADQQVVFIEQYRHGAEAIVLEIPGGMIDGEEDSETGARRELLEETGYSSENWVYLGKSLPNPAIQNNTIYHYLATDCLKTDETSFDEHESVATKLLPLADCGQMILAGEIRHSLVLAAFQYFYLRRENLK